MSSALRIIDVTVPATRLLPLPRRDGMPSRVAKALEVREGPDYKPVFKTTESLASGKGVTLPRFRQAIDAYQKNMFGRTAPDPRYIDIYA